MLKSANTVLILINPSPSNVNSKALKYTYVIVEAPAGSLGLANDVSFLTLTRPRVVEISRHSVKFN